MSGSGREGGPAFRIEHARSTADIEAVAALFVAYGASLDFDLGFQNFAEECATLPGRYAPPGGRLLLARLASGEAVGCVGLRRLAFPDCCEMKRLFVTSGARGLGLGEALVTAFVEAAREIGYREIRLDTVASMQSALRLYDRFGFRPIAPYNETPLPDAVFLSRPVDL